MGIELAAEGFREESLNRYASHQKIINAFEILKKNNIKEQFIILLDCLIKQRR